MKFGLSSAAFRCGRKPCKFLLFQINSHAILIQRENRWEISFERHEIVTNKQGYFPKVFEKGRTDR